MSLYITWFFIDEILLFYYFIQEENIGDNTIHKVICIAY